VKIALNLGSVSVVEKSVELIHELLGDRQIDLLIGNHEEFSTLFRGAPTDTIFESLSRHVDLAVYTRGERGALALHKSQIIQTSTTASVPVVDTSGAGDSFLGALLAGISRGNELQAALNCAHKVASLVVQQTGARLPNLPSDINELFERET
jgi:sugar/nucleoside kinase (ribokinase family)